MSATCAEPASNESQADRNFAAFQKLLPDLLPLHGGKFALIRNEQVIEFFDSLSDAVRFGVEKFGIPNKFSIQQVTNQNASLGLYGYAVHQLPH
jgi:hypothetical protein